jgi:nucleoside-triphosphatase
MGPEVRNILITGPPGIGKTTLIRRLAESLGDLNPAGFYTTEIRKKGVRKGFSLINLHGRARGILAHVDFGGRSRVSRYGVDIQSFERFLAEIEAGLAGAGLIVIDEIGKMECMSPRFRAFVNSHLASSIPVLATVAEGGSGLIAEVKGRRDVEVVAVTHENRESLLVELSPRIRQIARS